MSGNAELLEQELLRDLATLEQRFADEQFSTELYRALTNNVWRKGAAPGGHVSLSWRRADELVNELRARYGQEPLTLAQSGGEGEVSELVADELGRLGWSVRALNTSRHDTGHLGSPESAPPAEQGQRDAPLGETVEWERLAHEEAEEERRRRRGV